MNLLWAQAQFSMIRNNYLLVTSRKVLLKRFCYKNEVTH